MAESSLILKIRSWGHLTAPIGMMVIIFLMLVPLPSAILDLFFTLNIVIAISILLISTYIKDPIDFSVYPSILLYATLFRVALNISSTRLILMKGEEGTNAAGNVIGAFGKFVIGNNIMIGVVIFVIIVAFQYIVVATGAGRASEVTARFTLDKMPGKQLSIDADLNSGLITEKEAIERRQRIEKEADFYGSMDGAIKFTTKEAQVSIIITLINIVGGILIGVFQKGMDLAGAAETFTILTVGDGLMAAIPSLLVTISGGLITTRSASTETLGEDLTRQTLMNANPIKMAGGGMAILALIPGLPKLPFLLIGGALLFLAFQVDKQKKADSEAEEKDQQSQIPPPQEKIESLLKVDLLGLEIGYSLIPLVDAAQGGTLLQRIKSMRKQLALDLGIIVPPVRIRDNLQLGPKSYTILLKGIAIAQGEVLPSHHLAINPGHVKEKIKGAETKEPAFGLPAFWIGDEERERAQFLGYTIVDSATVITTHLTELIKRHAYELLGRQETQHLIEHIQSQYPKVVEELIPSLMSLGNVQKILQNLLKERVSVFDLRTILEALADYAGSIKDLGRLTEMVRQVLGRSIVRPYLTGNQDLPVLILDGQLENALIQKLQKIQDIEQLVIDTGSAHKLINTIKTTIEKSGIKVQPILLCSSMLRLHLRNLTERFLPELVILAANEIPASVNIVSLGVIQNEN
jgi:flagellar biosynthesis protein FlhA